MNGKLIVLEGIDGVGKTTISKILQKELLKNNIPTIRYEAYENKKKGFNKIKPFVKKDVPINSSLFFYLSSGIYKSEIIQKLLIKKWVICDRYVYSTLAYHKVRGADLSMVNLNNLPIIIPDFNFLIKLEEKTRITRVKNRKSSEVQDFKPKTPHNLIGKMEFELEKFKPIIIDNSLNINDTLKKIIEFIL